MLLDWLMVAVGLVLTVGTGLFVASEFALVNLDRFELEARERAARPAWPPPSTPCASPRRTCPGPSSASR